jgi:hypothetical protein
MRCDTQQFVNPPRAKEASFFRDLGVRIGKTIISARKRLLIDYVNLR